MLVASRCRCAMFMHVMPALVAVTVCWHFRALFKWCVEKVYQRMPA